MMVKERNDMLLGVEIFSLLQSKARTIEEVTEKIYGNQQSKNIVRVYQAIQIFLKRGLVVPKFKNGVLTFKVQKDKNNKK